MVFVGDGTDRKEMEAYAAEVDVNERCRWIGTVTEREALRAWYCRADLFLFPSTFDTNGLVVREAAACGLASVLIRNSPAAEGIEDGTNGFLIEENAASLYQLLCNCGQNRKQLRAVGECASRELYLSWDEAVKMALNRYQIVLEKQQNGFYSKHRCPSERLLRLNGELMEGIGLLSKHRKNWLGEKGKD